MAPIPRLAAAALLLPLSLVITHAADAVPSLAEAIKQTDANYLEAVDVQGTDSAPKIEAGAGEENTTPRTQEISQGAVKAVLSYVEQKGEEGEATRVPTELDPSNAQPEVVVSFYTGGAHCCSATSVLTANADGSSWSTVDVGEFDGGPLLATDLDGDGHYEFQTRDNAFLYAFACYACSEAPLEVLAIDNSAVKNVTSEPRFKPAHASYLKGMIENVPDEEVNGFLAGYVGEKILLGESKPAWDLMLAYYDKASDWGLDTCDQPLNEDGECPGREVKLTFPDALERMFKENGYKVEK
jgi:hypothetical protein